MDFFAITRTLMAASRPLLFTAQSGRCILCDEKLAPLETQFKNGHPNEITIEHLFHQLSNSKRDAHNMSYVALSHRRCNEKRDRNPLTKEQQLAVLAMQERLDRLLDMMSLFRCRRPGVIASRYLFDKVEAQGQLNCPALPGESQGV